MLNPDSTSSTVTGWGVVVLSAGSTPIMLGGCLEWMGLLGAAIGIVVGLMRIAIDGPKAWSSAKKALKKRRK